MSPSHSLPRWQRWLWMLAGGVCLAAALIGLLLPLLPTVPFVLLAAFCFSHGSERCEQWILAHPRFGPLVRNWRHNRAVPLRAKQFAVVMMSISSIGAALLVPLPWGLVPGVCCAAVGVWLWRLPTPPDTAS